MKKLIVILTGYLLLVGCASKKKIQSLNCNGDIIQAGLSVEGQAVCSHCEIEKEVFNMGISLVLKDTTYKISQFTVSYSNADKLLFQKEVHGSVLRSKDASFLHKLKEGDVLSIDCVKIIKDKKTSLSTTMLIIVR
jgi:hypothetical protein